MTSLPLVTVIIPSYNHAQYIRTAIDSVLAQTYENLELIIVDDGSRDDSHAVISEYSDHPKVATILNTQNRGQSAVLNQALAVSHGKYVALLPSDDWFLPEKTALQVAKMEACDDDVGVVYAAGARYYEDTGETVTVDLPVHTGWIIRDLIERGNFIYPVTPLYRREVFQKVRPSEQFKAEGEAIHLRIALYYRYEYIKQVVAVMRDHTYNTGKDAALQYEEINKILENFFDIKDLPSDVLKLKRDALFRNNATKGLQLVVDRRNFSMGRMCLRRAFSLNPKSLLNPKYAVAYLISMLPSSLSNYLLDKIRSLKETRHGAH